MDISTQILLTKLESIDHSLWCKLNVYVIAHTTEKPCTTNWYFSQNLSGNESQKSEQNLTENVYYQYPFTPIQNLKSLVRTRTLTAGTSGLIPKRNRLKLLTLQSPFCFFIIKILELIFYPEYFGVYFLW